MQNLYNMFRELVDAGPGVPLSSENIAFINSLLEGSEYSLHFQSRKAGEPGKEGPVMFQHYAISGSPEEIFCLVTEAMWQNPTFAQLIFSAGNWFRERAPLCRHCQQRHPGKIIEDCPNLESDNPWQFHERKR